MLRKQQWKTDSQQLQTGMDVNTIINTGLFVPGKNIQNTVQQNQVINLFSQPSEHRINHHLTLMRKSWRQWKPVNTIILKQPQTLISARLQIIILQCNTMEPLFKGHPGDRLQPPPPTFFFLNPALHSLKGTPSKDGRNSGFSSPLMLMNPSPKTKPSFKISFSSSAGLIFVRGSSVPPFSLRTDDTVTFTGYDMSAVRQSGKGTMAYLCLTQTGSRCHHHPLPLHPPHPWSPATQAKTLSHTTDQQAFVIIVLYFSPNPPQ